MRDSREVSELKERIDCLEEEKAEAERICSNMKESLESKIVQYKKVSELLSKEQQENASLKEQVKELECKLKYSENQCMELLNRCDELEKQLETMESLPVEPIEVAKLLINSEYEYETSEIQRSLLHKGDTDTCERYNIDELEQIAEHLLIYCKHNRGCEE